MLYTYICMHVVYGGMPPAASVIFTFTPALLAFPQKGFLALGSGFGGESHVNLASYSTCPYQGECGKWEVGY